MDEQSYIQGSRMAWLNMLGMCLRNLDIDDPERQKAAWVSEREEIIQQLRTICEEFGDNDWDETLHLADIIDKHLAKHLYLKTID